MHDDPNEPARHRRRTQRTGHPDRDEGEWTATQVMRVLERLEPFEAAA
jgi:hypothetical protein